MGRACVADKTRWKSATAGQKAKGFVTAQSAKISQNEAQGEQFLGEKYCCNLTKF